MDEELNYLEFKSPDIFRDFICGVEVMDKFLHRPYWESLLYNYRLNEMK